MTEMYIKSEIIEAFVSPDSVMKCECELSQWDIKPDLNLKSDEPTVTKDKYDIPTATKDLSDVPTTTAATIIGSQHLEQPDNIPIVFSKKCNGL